MNNKIKKPVLFLLCLSATLATLTACGKKTTKPDTVPTETITTEKDTTKKPPTGNPRVFFIVDGEIYQEVEYLPSTAAIVEPEIPAKAGYNIAKWSDYTLNGYDLYVFALYFKSNTTYKVEYYLQNLEDDEYTLKTEDTQSFTTTPDKIITPDINTYEGFNCINAETEYTLDEDSNKNIIKIYYDRNIYNINYDLDNGQSPKEFNLKYGATFPVITTPVKEGYTFDRFTVNGTDLDATKPVSESLNIKANYTANTNTAYTVKYYQENMYDDGYTLVEDDTQNLSGTTDTQASIEVDPNKYAGFTVNTEKTISSGNIDGNGSLELAIYYNRNKYNVTYKYADGVTEDVTKVVKYGALTNQYDVTRQGYTFKGWSESNSTSDIFNFNTEIKKDYTLYATYTANTGVIYKVKIFLEYENSDEYYENNSYTYSGYTNQLIEINPDDYLSELYEYNADLSTPSGNILADGSLELKLYYKLKVHKINFYDNVTGELITTIYKKHGQEAGDEPEELIRAGYDSTQFYDPSLGSRTDYYSFIDFIYNYSVFENEVYVSYQAKTNTIYKVRVYYENIEDENYSFVEELTFTGKTGTQIEPEDIENYVFDHASGYTEEDGLFIKGDGSTVIKAYYKRARIDISFNTNVEGVTIPTLEGVKYGAKISKPTIERVGYTLNYWSDPYTGNEVNFDTYIVEYEVQLLANWTAKTDTKFIVKHYLQNTDDDEYTLYDEVENHGTSDSNVYYGDYTINIEGAYVADYSDYTMKIAPDGSSVLSIYYYRQQFDVYFNYDEHIEFQGESSHYTLRYGAKFNVKGIFDNYLGFEIDGIYNGSNIKLSDTLEYELTVTGGISIYLRSKVISEMENFYFESTEDECIITGYRTQTPEVLVVPDIVTEISTLFNNNGVIQKVVFGKNLKKIRYGILQNCPNLTEVDFSNANKLEEIGERAFYDCNINNLSIPKCVKVIGKEAFYNNSNLETLVLEENSLLEEIGMQAFNNTNIKEFVLPSGIKKIGENTFNTLDMEEFIIPNSVEEINDVAFYDCKFKVLSFMDDTKLKVIPQYAFCGAYIDKVIIPNDVTKIGEGAFADAHIKELVFEDDSMLEEIDDYAFNGNNSIRALNLPNNLKTIGEEAFNQYNRISYVKVNSKLLEIKDNAFSGSTPTIILNYSDKTFVIGEDSYGYIAVDAQYIFNGDENDHILIDSEKGFVYKIVGEEKELLTYIGNDREVVIPNGVTKICNNAFYSNDSIISVIIPDSVTEIGSNAFCDCDILASVNIGSGVTSIGEYAFYSCENLVEVNNKSSLDITKGTYGYGYAGYYAINVTTEDSFTSNISYDEKFIKYVDNDDVYLVYYIGEDGVDEVIIDDDYTIIYRYALAYRSINKIVIGSGVKTISDYAFNYSYGYELVFKENSSLTYIGQYAFYHSYNIKNIVIPKSVKVIDEYAFNDCSSLETIVFEENSELETINHRAFASLTSLEEIVLPDSLITIEDEAFNNCYILNKVTFGTNLTTIGNNAFEYCSSIKEVVFTSDTLESIGDYAFAYCNALTEFYLGENVATIGNEAFIDTNIYSIYNKSSLPLVKGSDEFGMIALKALDIYSDIADKKTYVEDDFVYYKELDGDTVTNLYLLGYIGSEEDITISKDVTIIGASAFYRNEAIKNVTFEGNSKLREIGEFAFEGCDINVYELPSTLEKIGVGGLRYANNCITEDGVKYLGNSENPYVLMVGIDNSSFTINENCRIISSYSVTWENIETLVIPDSVIQIGEEAFAYCTIGSITLSSNLSKIEKRTFIEIHTNSIIIPKSVKEIEEQAFFNSDIQTITFEAGSKLTKIGDYAFSNCDNIVSIELPSMLKEIGIQAFYSCDALETVTFADDATITTIGIEAFYDCDSLTSFEFVDSIEVIEERAFYSCEALEDLVFSENSNLTTIKEEAFCYCNALQSIALPDSLVTIEERAFYGCTNLEAVTFTSNSSLTTIGKEAFKGCESLTSFTFPDSLEYIGESAFYNLGLNEIVFGENSNLTTIDKNAFYEMLNVTSIVLPKSLKYIKEYAFNQCQALVSISVAEGSQLEELGYRSFYYCRNLETIDLFYANNLQVIGEETFRDCSSTNSIILPEGLEKIETMAFYNCLRVDDSILVLPQTLTRIEENAFYYTRITELYFNGSLEDWINIEFGDNYANPLYTSYAKLYLKDDSGDVIKPFGKYSQITELIIPNTITSLDDYRFARIEGLKYVFIPSTVESIAPSTFYDISSYDTKYYYAGTYDEFVNAMPGDWGYPNTSDVYFYSEETPTDDDHKYWHYVDGKIMEYKYEEVLEIFNQLVEQIDYYLNGAKDGDAQVTVHIGDNEDENIIATSEEISLAFNALLNILNIDGKEELYTYLANYGYLIAFKATLDLTSGEISYTFNEEQSYIKGYKLAIIDNNLVLLQR